MSAGKGSKRRDDFSKFNAAPYWGAAGWRARTHATRGAAGAVEVLGCVGGKVIGAGEACPDCGLTKLEILRKLRRGALRGGA